MTTSYMATWPPQCMPVSIYGIFKCGYQREGCEWLTCANVHEWGMHLHTCILDLIRCRLAWIRYTKIRLSYSYQWFICRRIVQYYGDKVRLQEVRSSCFGVVTADHCSTAPCSEAVDKTIGPDGPCVYGGVVGVTCKPNADAKRGLIWGCTNVEGCAYGW